jgi:hypothetical protein
LAGEKRFQALGLGFISQKTIENGNGIEICAEQPLGRRTWLFDWKDILWYHYVYSSLKIYFSNWVFKREAQ